MAVSEKGYALTGLLGRGRGRGSASPLVRQQPNNATDIIVDDLLFTAGVGSTYTLTAQGGSYTLTGSSATITRTYNGGVVLQSAYNVDDSGAGITTIAATLSGVQEGSTIVAFVGWSDDTAGTNCSVSDGTSYTAAGDGKLLQVTEKQNSQVFYLQNAGSGNHTVTATLTNTTTHCRIRLFEVAGVATSLVEDRAAHQQQNTVGTTTNSISSSATSTTTNANDFVLGLTQDTMNADPGTGTMAAGTGFTLIGTNQILAAEYKNVTSTGAQTATFTDSKNSNRTTHVLVLKTLTTGSTNYQLTAQGGSYTVTGSSAILKRSKYIAASGGSYTVTGGTASLLRSKKIVASGGSYVVSGASANLLRSRLLVAQGGSYTYTGQQVTITYTAGSANYTLTCSGGSYAIIGASAVLSRNRTLTVSGGSYSITGASALLYRNRKLTASGGSYNITGATATILRSKVLVASGGVYSLTGQSAILSRNRMLVASGGAYTYQGSNVVITKTSIGGYPAESDVLLGVVYGPSGEYTGTLDIGKKFRIDIATGNIVMIIDEGKVMSL